MQKCTHQRRREWPQLELKMLVYEILGGHCTRKTFRCKRSTLHLKWLSPSHVRNKFYNALSPLQQQTFSFCANIYLKKRGASGEPCGTPRKLSCPSRLSENCHLHLAAKLITSATIFSQTSICFSLALLWASGEQAQVSVRIEPSCLEIGTNATGLKKKKEAESNHAFGERCPQPCTSCLQRSDIYKCLR